jgi:hypothetical protein
MGKRRGVVAEVKAFIDGRPSVFIGQPTGPRRRRKSAQKRRQEARGPMSREEIQRVLAREDEMLRREAERRREAM